MSLPKNSRQRSTVRILIIAAVLVVIGALLVFAYFSAVRWARSMQAEVHAKEIAYGLNAYFSEYGKLPTVKAGNANTAKLINTLAAMVQADPDNPKALVFLDPPKAKKHRNGAEMEGANRFSSGFKDPWGNEYEIRIDPDIAAHPKVPSVEGPDGPVAKPAIVWSRGDPSWTHDYENPAKWIKSWE